MRDYRIAFLTTDWNYELVETTLHGAKQFVEDHKSVYLRVFDCFGKDQDTPKDRAEYAIFDLVDLREFDGVLIQGNQIVLNPVREALAQKVVEAGIPAVSIDCPLDGCTLVGVDNQQAQHDLADHVIRHHGARKLVYLTGLLGNGCPEGSQRLNGFKEACRENGIPDEDIQVIECTWRTSDGRETALRWLHEGRPLPDAFICANDEMALGLLEVLKAHNRHIPEDVIITGFDNLSSAELASPRLSTVRRDSFKLNYRALEVLIGMIDGTETRRSVPFECDIICSESCGCKEQPKPDYIRNQYFQQTQLLKSFYTLQDRMAEELFDASTLVDLKDIIQSNQGIFGVNNVYVCINDYYFDNYEKKHWTQDSECFGQSMVLAACGNSNTPVGQSLLYTRFPTRDLLPKHLMRSERFLTFYPLHYNTYSIGYIAMDSISKAAKLNLHKSIFSFLEIGIENMRKKALLRQLNDVLDDLYVHDGLTGLYNRFGYDRYGHQTFDAFMEEFGEAQILFIDMDDMKGINDRFGHDAGDAAICATADILKRVCGPRDFLMRYGGDEFLAIVSPETETLDDDIVRATREVNDKNERPYNLSLSIGLIRASVGDGRSLDDYIRDADVEMYDHKSRHANRTSRRL